MQEPPFGPSFSGAVAESRTALCYDTYACMELKTWVSNRSFKFSSFKFH